MRKAITDRGGSIYCDKQESLDHIDILERSCFGFGNSVGFAAKTK